MKKHMLKETNSMRRLMGLNLLKEDFEETGVMGVDAPESKDELEKDEEDHGDVVNEEDVVGVDAPESKDELEKDEEDHGDVVNEQSKEVTMEEKDKYCQKHFKCDYKDCDDKQKAQCDKECGKAVNEDSEGEETYNYGEDEGADEHREDEMEDELHHDKEDMAPHDRIKAIEDHLEALKKDMGYDEDHEDRDEEGTHFAEGKRYNKVLNTLSESEYKKLKKFIK
jgi:hypothetical protein